jgi:hypothetical protein
VIQQRPFKTNVLFPMFIPYKTFAEPMLIFEDIDARSKYWLLSNFCFKFAGQVCHPTSRTANKEEQMRRYYRTLTQIEENIIKVVRLKHPNYEVKHLHHCIAHNVSSCSR